VVDSVRRLSRRVRAVYNLEVAGAHTYYAGVSPILVHNQGDGCGVGDEPTRYQPEGNLDPPAPGSAGGPTAFKRFGGRGREDFLERNPFCVWCGDLAKAIDHVIARSRGGNTTPENRDAICTGCNSSKRDRDAISQARWAAVKAGEIGKRFVLNLFGLGP